MNEWIDVEIKNPPLGEVVLVCDKLNNFVTLGRLIEYDEDDPVFELMFIDDVEIDSIVTHWQKLPEVPHE